MNVGYRMALRITSEYCSEEGKLTEDEISLDKSRVKFILRRKIRGMAGRKRLGSLWLVLHPVLLSLVYLFVFTVIRSNPNSVNIFVGISMFNIFSSSIKSGVNSVRDFSGGIKGERVRTRVVSKAMLNYRVVDVLLQSSGVSVILFCFLGVGMMGIIAFTLLCLVVGIVAELFALNLSLAVRRVPDISNFIDYSLMLMFFGSPVLYPMSMTSGLHRTINEYNPFAFFVEGARRFVDVDSVIDEILGPEAFAILFVIGILSMRGYHTLDRLRWEVSSWS